MKTTRTTSWAVLPVLALFMACSAQEGRGPLDPSSTAGLEADEVGSGTFRASLLPCSLTQGYWKNHPEAWPVEEIPIGGAVYTRAEALVILSTPPAHGDATYILAHQLIAAKLNILNGADGADISDTIDAADAWLAANPLGSRPKADRKSGIALAETLDRYNNGLIGPGHCDDDPTPLPSPSPSPSPSTPPPQS